MCFEFRTFFEDQSTDCTCDYVHHFDRDSCYVHRPDLAIYLHRVFLGDLARYDGGNVMVGVVVVSKNVLNISLTLLRFEIF